LFCTTSHTGQQPNTIPIQYYFIEDGRRIQDRNGIDSN
jgi:hypothetical protein